MTPRLEAVTSNCSARVWLEIPAGLLNLTGRMPRRLLSILLAITALAFSRGAADEDWKRLVESGELVEVTSIDPTILVEMRYATDRNGAKAALYPPDFPCLVRPEVATHLRFAQNFLRKTGHGLKIWDAYRPAYAQEALWKVENNRRFVANPTQGRGSLHTWGLAVDVTLVDRDGKEAAMPTDFDVFAEDASGIYRGSNDEVHANVHLLQYAMMRMGGFQGLSTEWWHFAVRGWRDYPPLSKPPTS